MKKVIIYFILINLSLFSAFSLYAAENSADTSPNQTTNPELGLVKSPVKNYHLELEPFGGEYLGDDLENTWLAGGRVSLRISKSFYIGTEFTYSRIEYDSHSTFGETVKNHDEYVNSGYIIYSLPVFQQSGKYLREMDLYTTFGLGNVRVNSINNFAGLIGGGMKMYTSVNWLAIRVDVNTYIYGLPIPKGYKINDDWLFSVGPCFLF